MARRMVKWFSKLTPAPAALPESWPSYHAQTDHLLNPYPPPPSSAEGVRIGAQRNAIHFGYPPGDHGWVSRWRGCAHWRAAQCKPFWVSPRGTTGVSPAGDGVRIGAQRNANHFVSKQSK